MTEPRDQMEARAAAHPARVMRLHPSSLFFEIGRSFFSIVVMGLLVLFLAAGDRREVLYMVLFLPVVVRSVIRYLTLRYSLKPDHLLITEGLVFRKSRQVPYARIENIDTLQGPFHRLLGVVEARLETAGGQEPEAVFRVVTVPDVETIRAGVFRGRKGAAVHEPEVAEREEDTLFRMRPRDVFLFGLFSQRGLVYLGGAMALAWEFDLWERATEAVERYFDLAVLQQHPWLLSAVVLGLLSLLQILTVAWGFLTLHDFKIARRGNDLRTTCGLLTRQSATIPRDRIQFLSVRAGWMHRLFRRVSVKVRTAGGDSTRDSQLSRKWLVPLVRREGLHEVLAQVQPESVPASLSWNAVHPKARRRMFFRWIIVFSIPVLLGMRQLSWWAFAAYLPLVPLAFFLASLRARRLSWSLSDRAVFLRDGRIAHTRSCVRFSKIQSVSMSQTPFDRRMSMATVRVDTAGSGGADPGFLIPFLDVSVAREVLRRLRHEAAATTFRW